MKKILILLLLALGISGCMKMPNVKIYADAIVETKSEIDLIATDFSVSSKSIAQYYLNMEKPKEGDSKAVAKYNSEMEIAAIWGDSGKLFAELNYILIAYGVALQKLTQDEAVDFSKAVSECTQNADVLMKKIGNGNLDSMYGKGMKDAVETAASLFSKWASEVYRQREIKRIFREDGVAIQNYMIRLRDASVNGYGVLLEREYKAGNKYFGDLLKEDSGRESKVALGLLKERKMNFENSIEARKAIRLSYYEKMNAIIEAHNALIILAECDSLDLETLVEQVQLLVTDIYKVRGKFDAIEKE